MKYERIQQGRFISRPNRFIAHVEIDGKTEVCHVKNTGRCRELLIPGALVFVQKSLNKDRKTAYDLISVQKGNRLINMDSQIPNRVAEEWIQKGNLFGWDAKVYSERKYGNSRFDLYIEQGGRKIFMEVKGVTLETDGMARFPDAPTVRGVKHVKELCTCLKNGYEAYIMFVIQMEGVSAFEPNWDTHPEFARALREAEAKGVRILAYDCEVRKDLIILRKPVTVYLGK